MFKSYRKESRENYGSDGGGNLTLDQLKVGALLRIADAAELMVKRHQELIAERNNYKGWWELSARNYEAAKRQNAALRGVITKLKRKLEGGG